MQIVSNGQIKNIVQMDEFYKSIDVLERKLFSRVRIESKEGTEKMVNVTKIYFLYRSASSYALIKYRKK